MQSVSQFCSQPRLLDAWLVIIIIDGTKGIFVCDQAIAALGQLRLDLQAPERGRWKGMTLANLGQVMRVAVSETKVIMKC